MGLRHVMWDFNGTLVDDRGLAHEILCLMTARWKLPPVSLSEYLRHFRHPVSAYYAHVGFTPSEFPHAVSFFHEEYQARVGGCSLHAGAAELLAELAATGISQSVLSAAEQTMLEKLVGDFGLATYFESLLGLQDHHAVSKVDNGRQHMAELGLPPAEVLFVGDTDHDAEVAAAIGCPCVLLALGHQDAEVLGRCGYPVVHDFAELRAFIFTHRSRKG